MNKKEQKLKKELVENIITDLEAKSNILKSLDIISDYKVDVDIENLSIAEDGVLEYDVYIHQKVIPKKSIGNITVDFKILPPDCNT